MLHFHYRSFFAHATTLTRIEKSYRLIIVSFPTLHRVCSLHVPSFRRSLNLGADYNPMSISNAFNIARSFIDEILTPPQDMTNLVSPQYFYWSMLQDFTFASSSVLMHILTILSFLRLPTYHLRTLPLVHFLFHFIQTTSIDFCRPLRASNHSYSHIRNRMSGY